MAASGSMRYWCAPPLPPAKPLLLVPLLPRAKPWQECNKSMYAELENHGTIGRIRPVLRRSILEALPPDAHLRASGRITIAVT